MRVYISVDMEGVAGVVHEDQTNPIDPRCAGVRLGTGDRPNTHIEDAERLGCGFAHSNSPRDTVTALPPSWTRSPFTSTRTSPPRADAWKARNADLPSRPCQ